MSKAASLRIFFSLRRIEDAITREYHEPDMDAISRIQQIPRIAYTAITVTAGTDSLRRKLGGGPDRVQLPRPNGEHKAGVRSGK